MPRHRLTDAYARRAKHSGKGRYTDVADSDLRGFFLRVASSGTKTWFVRHRGTDRREFFATWPDTGADDARERAIELRRGVPTKTTIARLVAHYREHYTTKRGRRPGDSSNTRNRLDLITEHLGHLDIGRVKPDQIRKMLKVKAEFPVEQNRTLELLSSLYTYAEAEGWHSGPRPTRAVRRNAEKPRNRRVLPHERATLLEAIRALATPVPRGVLELVAEYGARASEVCNLEWADVLPDRLIFNATKTGTSRAVPLTDLARRVLDERRLAGHSERWVFAWARGKGPIARSSVWKWWDRARKVSGIEDIRIHDLRHERATTWAQQGVPLAVVAKIAGHKDVRTTLRVYQDVVEQDVFDVFNGENAHAEPGGTRRNRAEPQTCIAQDGAWYAACDLPHHSGIPTTQRTVAPRIVEAPGHPYSTE